MPAAWGLDFCETKSRRSSLWLDAKLPKFQGFAPAHGKNSNNSSLLRTWTKKDAVRKWPWSAGRKAVGRPPGRRVFRGGYSSAQVRQLMLTGWWARSRGRWGFARLRFRAPAPLALPRHALEPSFWHRPGEACPDGAS